MRPPRGVKRIPAASCRTGWDPSGRARGGRIVAHPCGPGKTDPRRARRGLPRWRRARPPVHTRGTASAPRPTLAALSRPDPRCRRRRCRPCAAPRAVLLHPLPPVRSGAAGVFPVRPGHRADRTAAPRAAGPFDRAVLSLHRRPAVRLRPARRTAQPDPDRHRRRPVLRLAGDAHDAGGRHRHRPDAAVQRGRGGAAAAAQVRPGRGGGGGDRPVRRVRRGARWNWTETRARWPSR